MKQVYLLIRKELVNGNYGDSFVESTLVAVYKSKSDADREAELYPQESATDKKYGHLLPYHPWFEVQVYDLM